MAITYYKRFRMEVDLAHLGRPAPLPRPFRWVAWSDDLLHAHAQVKYACFRDELDAFVFPCLGDRQGCLRLMREIRRKAGFLPGATWMIAGPDGYCATIQGVADLARRGVRFVNRQGGSGTRLLLDALLQRADVDARSIEGYEILEYTHAAVAAYEQVVGEAWKPFDRPVDNPGQTLDRKAAAAQMSAFD